MAATVGCDGRKLAILQFAIYILSYCTTGEVARKGDLRLRITVILQIINFSMWILAQIVANRDENQIRSEWPRMSEACSGG